MEKREGARNNSTRLVSMTHFSTQTPSQACGSKHPAVRGLSNTYSAHDWVEMRHSLMKPEPRRIERDEPLAFSSIHGVFVHLFSIWVSILSPSTFHQTYLVALVSNCMSTRSRFLLACGSLRRLDSFDATHFFFSSLFTPIVWLSQLRIRDQLIEKKIEYK